MPKPNSIPMMCSTNDNHATQSRNSFRKNPKNKKLMFVKLKGLGCKDSSLPASTPTIIRSAADWEAKRRKHKKRGKSSRNNPANVNVVDVPDVCCTPPGIGIASDFAPRTRNAPPPHPRIDHRKHPREVRRNGHDPAPNCGVIGSRTNLRSAEEIIEMLMSQQNLWSERIRLLHGHDRYQNWRLNNVDDMSYEELLDLSENIGYVGTGLQEDEITTCLRKLRHSESASVTVLKNWKCSICQEKCRKNDEIGKLDCGHYHHVQCIKQWLLQKNVCPVCKSAAMPEDKSK